MKNNVNKLESESFSVTSEERKYLEEILGIEKLSLILNQFHNATKIACSITDLNGDILHKVGWKNICTEFHRKNKISLERCIKSNKSLAKRIKGKKHTVSICHNGMVDVATPVIINGVHAANFIMGQFFLEKPDKTFFISQAAECGFNRGKYMKALDECQVYDKKTILEFSDFFISLINMIAETAIKSKEQKEKHTAELAASIKELTFQNNINLFLGYHDNLTGLNNRTFFEIEIKRLNAENLVPVSIIVGDINGMKLINDSFGHIKGDEVIIEMSKILKNCCGKDDIISRTGGEEFIIILPDADTQYAQTVCNRISDACKVFVINGLTLHPSISLGYATKKNKTETLDNILLIAEESMFMQKLLEIRSVRSSIISSIKVIMFEKSQETEEHAERLIRLTKLIGSAMNLKEDQLNELELLSTLHDIGKMSIDANVLSKGSKLDKNEWYNIKKHPEVGYRIAQATSELAPIAKYILCHHERWDGKGYPQGLAGEETPLLCRILAVADAYDAMTNDRPYRSAMTKDEALEEIRKNSGTQFDPEIALLFIKIIQDEGS